MLRSSGFRVKGFSAWARAMSKGFGSKVCSGCNGMINPKAYRPVPQKPSLQPQKPTFLILVRAPVIPYRIAPKIRLPLHNRAVGRRDPDAQRPSRSRKRTLKPPGPKTLNPKRPQKKNKCPKCPEKTLNVPDPRPEAEGAKVVPCEVIPERCLDETIGIFGGVVQIMHRHA